MIPLFRQATKMYLFPNAISLILTKLRLIFMNLITAWIRATTHIFLSYLHPLSYTYRLSIVRSIYGKSFQIWDSPLLLLLFKLYIRFHHWIGGSGNPYIIASLRHVDETVYSLVSTNLFENFFLCFGVFSHLLWIYIFGGSIVVFFKTTVSPSIFLKSIKVFLSEQKYHFVILFRSNHQHSTQIMCSVSSSICPLSSIAS